MTPPGTPAALREFLRIALNLDVPDTPLVAGNDAPLAYLVHTFFEGRFTPHAGAGPHARASPADCVVWANRGGGKTFLGAVATLLDLVFKPGIEIRILGGSLEQSQRMHEHLRRLFELPCIAPIVDGRITERRLALLNGSRAQVLAQSQTSVRGTRVQKVRCDEAELFEPEVWEAAQLTTRSVRLAGPWGQWVRGAVEALSTLHKPFGLMWNIVGSAARPQARSTGADHDHPDHRPDAPVDPVPLPAARRVLFRWGLVDVLGSCGPEHSCDRCPLRPECGGRAKARDASGLHALTHPLTPSAVAAPATLSGPRRVSPGHVSIDDAIGMKSRVSESVWQSEMLCLRPRRTDCVYPEFDASVHVGRWEPPRSASEAGAGDAAPRAAWVAGMDFGFRSPTVVLLAWIGEEPGDDAARPVLHIEAEHVQSEWTIHQHIAHIQKGLGLDLPRPAWIGVDPAGNQRSEQTGLSAVTAMRRAGLVVRSRRFELHEGIELVRARLRPASGTHGSSPTLYIHARCTQLIESMHRYHYPEERPESLDPVKDGFDHAADALRYLMVNLDRPHTTTHASYLH